MAARLAVAVLHVDIKRVLHFCHCLNLRQLGGDRSGVVKRKVGGTLTSVGMPRVRPPPGRTMMASKVPSMFLKRCMVSRLVASPRDERTASDAIQPECQAS